jgi:hypothetical protein
MPFVHKRVSQWAFPISALMTQAVGMTASPMSAQRVAELRLRSSGGPLRTRVWWPHSPAPGATAGLLMFFVDTEATARGACLENAMAAVEWAADHARELEADPGRLLVGGTGAGAALAAAVALCAHDRRWPPIARQLLIGLDLEGADGPMLAGSPDDVAPATVVTFGEGDHDGRRYAARLRGVSVDVDELDQPDHLVEAIALSLIGPQGPC